jgi:hypothetical protein
MQALDDVPRIRAIWARHFSKWKRPKGDPVSAEAIAADRHADPHDLTKAIHDLTKAMVVEAIKRGVRGLRNLPSKSTEKMGSS